MLKVKCFSSAPQPQQLKVHIMSLLTITSSPDCWSISGEQMNALLAPLCLKCQRLCAVQKGSIAAHVLSAILQVMNCLYGSDCHHDGSKYWLNHELLFFFPPADIVVIIYDSIIFYWDCVIGTASVSAAPLSFVLCCIKIKEHSNSFRDITHKVQTDWCHIGAVILCQDVKHVM